MKIFPVHAAPQSRRSAAWQRRRALGTADASPIAAHAGSGQPARARTSGAALASLALMAMLAALNTSIANVALPSLAESFGASFPAVQWVVLSYLLATTTLIVGAGRLGDMAGRRRLLLIGAVVFTAAALVCGLAPTLGLLIAARAVQGFGAALMMALTLAFAANVSRQRSGRVIGLLGTMSALGTALGPAIGGVLLAAWGWRAAFFVSVPLGLIATLLAYHGVPHDTLRADSTGRRFDVAGTLLLVLALAAYALAMTVGRGRWDAYNVILLAGAALGAGLFLHVEAKAAEPLLRLEIVRNRGRLAGLASSALVSTVVMATLVVGPFYLADSLGLGATAVGLLLAVGPLVAALTGVPAGRMVDRFGTQRMTLVGLAGLAAGSLLLAALPTSLGALGYAAPIIILTAGYALFQTANNTAVLQGAEADERGVVSGVLTLSRNLGLITGASLMGAVFVCASGASDIVSADPNAVAAGMRVTFAVAAGLIVAALAIAAWGREERS